MFLLFGSLCLSLQCFPSWFEPMISHWSSSLTDRIQWTLDSANSSQHSAFSTTNSTEPRQTSKPEPQTAVGHVYFSSMAVTNTCPPKRKHKDIYFVVTMNSPASAVRSRLLVIHRNICSPQPTATLPTTYQPQFLDSYNPLTKRPMTVKQRQYLSMMFLDHGMASFPTISRLPGAQPLQSRSPVSTSSELIIPVPPTISKTQSWILKR